MSGISPKGRADRPFVAADGYAAMFEDAPPGEDDLRDLESSAQIETPAKEAITRRVSRMSAAAFAMRRASWLDDREALQAIRQRVFIAEQGMDPAEEFDDADPTCQHVLGVAGTGEPIGTARIDLHGRIGRMAVLMDWRGRGVGRAILTHVLEFARERGLERVHLHAQLGALGFYSRCGFVPIGPRFLEAGIEHQRMERTLREAQASQS